MAGSANIAAPRTLSVNITIITIRVNLDHRVRRWLDGLTTNNGGGSYAPAVVSQKT